MNIELSKLRSLWVILPKPLNQSGAIIGRNGIHVDQVMQREGDPLWAIRSGPDLCLGKDDEWIVEPLPASRDEEYIRNYRFSSINEATNFVLRYESKNCPTFHIESANR
jgi:hypothetical protein